MTQPPGILQPRRTLDATKVTSLGGWEKIAEILNQCESHLDKLKMLVWSDGLLVEFLTGRVS
jgi:hypothetical protein